MTAYYNEIDPFAAQWLRNLIDAGHIAPGVVDTRSIEDVVPNELKGFTQCHFFAGVGVWSLALRRAGWPDDRSVWTGSCPCQPFSSAGASGGFADERHLWPTFFHLIEQCKPATVLGEQVASKDAEPWLDLVQDDLEAVGYAVGAVAFPAASVGAPHIRDRLYWLADLHGERRGEAGHSVIPTRNAQRVECNGVAVRLADSDEQQRDGCGASGPGGRTQSTDRGAAVGLADTEGERRAGELLRAGAGLPQDGTEKDRDISERPSPTNGYWRDADWLLCRDGKWRPVEPGTFPLVDGASSRVGRLRAYGNAINAQAAQAFIEATGL